jgi:hypothetical protein
VLLQICATSSSSDCCATFYQSGSCVTLMSTGWPYFAINPEDNSKCLNGPPSGWLCAANAYGDGICDCGCGIPDELDCVGSAACHCTSPGSCAALEGNCDYIDPEHPEHCLSSIPPNWHCPLHQYNDHEYCDCGCGAYDPDCDNATSVNDCYCSDSSCSPDCSAFSDGSYALCDSWSCEIRRYSDGVCDCGCGGEDPDCTTTTGLSVCMTCATPGSCASSCNEIDPTNNTHCKQ